MDLLERSELGADRHPWERTRAEFLLALAEHGAGLGRRPLRWLDLGSGDAWLALLIADRLRPGSTMTCWDAHYTFDDIAALTGPPRADVALSVAPPAGTFNVISLFDVVEHVDDDRSFLGGLVRDHLAPDGVALITVPAYQRLFSDHDVALRHHRRYSPRAARRLFEACGLTVDTEGGLFTSLLPVRAAQVVAQRLRRRAPGAPDPAAGVGHWQGGPVVSGIVRSALALDARAGLWAARHGVRLPGLSYWAVCRPAPQ